MPLSNHGPDTLPHAFAHPWRYKKPDAISNITEDRNP